MGRTRIRSKTNHVSNVAKWVTGKGIAKKTVRRVEILVIAKIDETVLALKLRKIEQRPGTKNFIVLCTRAPLVEDAAVGHVQL